MKLSNIFLVLFFLLAFNQPFRSSVCKADFYDYAPSHEVKKKCDSPEQMKTFPCKYSYEKYNGEQSEPLSVKVHYEPSKNERISRNRKIKISQKELTGEEMQAVKLAGQKCKKQAKPISKSSERVVKVELEPTERSYTPEVKNNGVFCLDCDECEMQVKANGEGVILKCTNCQELPTNDFTFLKDNTRKTLRLP